MDKPLTNVKGFLFYIRKIMNKFERTKSVTIGQKVFNSFITHSRFL